jgi:hypothetical protein
MLPITIQTLSPEENSKENGRRRIGKKGGESD